jgi:DNA polymerase III delta prime subunit
VSNPLRSLFSGLVGRRAAVEAVEPWRTFDDVILPASTRAALENALDQVRHHNLIFERWGLGQRHSGGLGLAFNFAGPPGTGKTICAEAIAHALGKRLLVVRYAELASMWVGETAKNVTTIFQEAEEEDAVLFFDEADAIAGRRFTNVSEGYQREMNSTVNVLLRELEVFNGVVIFATNLASNFDPAFERRIRTHVFFEMPGVEERARIWKAQLHPSRTPIADDVDFHALAERFERSGGDIKNAVLKAAMSAAAETGADDRKAIHQRHFVHAMEEVVSARRVMDQSLFGESVDPAMNGMAHMLSAQSGTESAVRQLTERVDALSPRVDALSPRVEALAPRLAEVAERTESLEQRDAETARRTDDLERRDAEAARRTESLERRWDALEPALEKLTAAVAAAESQVTAVVQSSRDETDRRVAALIATVDVRFRRAALLTIAMAVAALAFSLVSLTVVLTR